MDFLREALNHELSDYSEDIQKCPFLRNINKPTNLSFASRSFSFNSSGAKGPIFEDGANFELAFNLFHGKDGVVPLSENSQPCISELEAESATQFNALASEAASISMPPRFNGFHSLFGKEPNKSYKKKDHPTKGATSKHEAQQKEWLKHSNCLIAKSYRAVSKVLPLIATVLRPPPAVVAATAALVNTALVKTIRPQPLPAKIHEALQNEWLIHGCCPITNSYRAVSKVHPRVAKVLRPPPGIKLKCPPAVIAARAVLAKTALVKIMRPQSLPAKIIVIAVLGIAANIPLGMWREHTKKFSPEWFTAVHAAVPFIAMLRKSVVMSKSAMVLTLAGSILGQIIGSRAERFRLKAKAGGAAMWSAGNHVGPSFG